jgi:vacuolar-type H+-ATPase subunit F/Vma7
MSLPVYIGDEVSAAGFRLAGLQVITPRPGDIPAVVKRACEQAPLVLISVATAQHLDARALDVLLAGMTPPVTIVPDVHGSVPMPDLATRLREQLGVLE